MAFPQVGQSIHGAALTADGNHASGADKYLIATKMCRWRPEVLSRACQNSVAKQNEK